MFNFIKIHQIFQIKSERDTKKCPLKKLTWTRELSYSAHTSSFSHYGNDLFVAVSAPGYVWPLFNSTPTVRTRRLPSCSYFCLTVQNFSLDFLFLHHRCVHTPRRNWFLFTIFKFFSQSTHLGFVPMTIALLKQRICTGGGQ